MFLGFPLYIILYALIDYLRIHVHITFNVHDLGALEVTQKIQVMSFLQDDKLFTVDSWI